MPTVFDPIQTPLASTAYQNIPNILDNGGFEIWQRGNTFSPAVSLTYTADRWQNFTSQPTLAITKETTIIDSGTSSMKVVVTGTTGSNRWSIFQGWEPCVYPAGTTFTASVRVWSNVANSIRIGLSSNNSAYHPGDSTWRTLSVSVTPVISNLNQFNLALGALVNGDAANGTVYFDSAIMVVSSVAVPFVPTPQQVDLARCQRYFLRIGGIVEYVGMAQATSTTGGSFRFQWPTTMRAVPTVTVNSPTSFSAIGPTGTVIPLTTLTPNNSQADNSLFVIGTASGLVAGNAAIVFVNATTGFIDVSADV